MKAKLLRDDPVLEAYVLRKIKELHEKESEKMSDAVKQFMQKEVDRMLKVIPELILKKKNDMSRN